MPCSCSAPARPPAARERRARRPGAGSRRSAASRRAPRWPRPRPGTGRRRRARARCPSRTPRRRRRWRCAGTPRRRAPPVGEREPAVLRPARAPSRSGSGSTTTATLSWFFAAARTIAGPADVDLLDALVRRGARRDRLGERVEVRHQQVERRDARARRAAATCSGRRVSASSPACTRGCRVLTRPSRHSGKPVSSSTGVTGTPASAIRCAVEPVETISTPSACSPVASSAQRPSCRRR